MAMQVAFEEDLTASFGDDITSGSEEFFSGFFVKF